jgi:hypothetical protein
MQEATILSQSIITRESVGRQNLSDMQSEQSAHATLASKENGSIDEDFTTLETSI